MKADFQAGMGPHKPGIDKEIFCKPQDDAYGLLAGCLPLSMTARASASIYLNRQSEVFLHLDSR